MTRIIYFAIALFLYSCGRTNVIKQIGTEDKTRSIHIVSRPDSVITKVSAIGSEIEYISLQPPANSPIKEIDKIIIRGNKIYVNLINDLMCFDDHGNFLYQLYGNDKENEGNVVAIYDFDIDKGDTSLIVLYGNKILHFKNTGSGFDYINTTKLGRLSPSKLDFVPGTNKVLLSSTRMKGFEPTLHIVINMNGDTLFYKQNNFKRFNPVKNRIWDMIIHYQSNNKLHFKERFNDTIFSIDAESNSFTPCLILDSRVSSTNSENINDPDYFKILPNVVTIFEDSRFLYFAYNFSDINHKVFYDKYEDIKYEIDPVDGVLKDDIAGGPDFDPKFSNEGSLYSWISVREFKLFAESEGFIEAQVQNYRKHEELKRLILLKKDSDNPIIIKVRLKN